MHAGCAVIAQLWRTAEIHGAEFAVYYFYESDTRFNAKSVYGRHQIQVSRKFFSKFTFGNFHWEHEDVKFIQLLRNSDVKLHFALLVLSCPKKS